MRRFSIKFSAEIALLLITGEILVTYFMTDLSKRQFGKTIMHRVAIFKDIIKTDAAKYPPPSHWGALSR
jgi:hypothetical protein